MDIYIDINQPLSPLYSSEAKQSTIRSLTLKRGNESIINVNVIGTSTISWYRTKLTIKRAGRYDDPPVIDGYCDGAGGAIKILAESQSLRDDLGVGKGRDIPQVHYIGEITLETYGSNPRRLACKTFDVVVQNNVERGEDAPVDPPRPNYPPADQVATKNEAVPAGGTAGQVLAKVDDVDRNAAWIDPPAGGSASRKRLILMATNEATPRGDGTYNIVLANGNLNFDLDHLAGGVTPADIDYIEEIDLVLKIPDKHAFDGNALIRIVVDIQRIKKDFAQDIDNPKQMIVNIIFESLSLIEGSKKSIVLSGWASVGESKFIYMGGVTLQRYMLSSPSSAYGPIATLLAQEADTSAHIVAEHNTSNVAHPDMRQQMTSLVKASVPIGGTAGQMLAKASATNNDVAWVDPPSGGGSADKILPPLILNPSSLQNGELARGEYGSTRDLYLKGYNRICIPSGQNTGESRYLSFDPDCLTYNGKKVLMEGGAVGSATKYHSVRYLENGGGIPNFATLRADRIYRLSMESYFTAPQWGLMRMPNPEQAPDGSRYFSLNLLSLEGVDILSAEMSILPCPRADDGGEYGKTFVIKNELGDDSSLYYSLYQFAMDKLQGYLGFATSFGSLAIDLLLRGNPSMEQNIFNHTNAAIMCNPNPYDLASTPYCRISIIEL